MAGFGASGRNGGWCSALFATSDAALARQHGVEAMRAMRRAMQETVDVVGASAASEGIDCHFAKGGSIDLVRSEAQRARALDEVDEARALGFGEDDLRWLGPDETRGGHRRRGRARARRSRRTAPCCSRRSWPAGWPTPSSATACASTSTPRCSPSTPARRATARRCARAGGTVRAEFVVRATEAWTPTLPGLERAIVPVYSLMVATEPLGADFWAQAGLEGRATFADHRHMIIYGQRTADDRIAFGGRGAPYHFGSTISPAFDSEPAVHALLRQTLAELFPEVADARFTHAWGGPLGIPRDWHSSVGPRPRHGPGLGRRATSGDGVSTTNLAGRTLADLITGADTPLTRLPWVGHVSPRWEPEPLRWLGVNAGLWTMKLADRSETRRGRPSRLAGAMGRLLGQ